MIRYPISDQDLRVLIQSKKASWLGDAQLRTASQFRLWVWPWQLWRERRTRRTHRAVEAVIVMEIIMLIAVHGAAPDAGA